MLNYVVNFLLLANLKNVEMWYFIFSAALIPSHKSTRTVLY